MFCYSSNQDNGYLKFGLEGSPIGLDTETSINLEWIFIYICILSLQTLRILDDLMLRFRTALYRHYTQWLSVWDCNSAQHSLGEDYGVYTQMWFCVQTARHSASDGREQNTGDSMKRPRRDHSDICVNRPTVKKKKKTKKSANGTCSIATSDLEPLADYFSNTLAVNAIP